MAAKKQVKTSKKLTTKNKDLPESVQWLLDFANLGSKPGVQNPSKVSEYHEVKRPPIDPPAHKDLPEIVSTLSGSVPVTDRNGYRWIDYGDGSIYKGREDYDPTLKEFKEFLKKTGIKKGKDCGHWTLKQVWKCTSYSFFCVMDIKPVDYKFYAAEAEGFVYYNYTHSQISLSKPSSRELGNLIKGLKYSHDGTLTQVVGAYILDFWHNHRELHKSLWQCLCCGKFKVEQEVKGVGGRKKKYCSDECRKTFHLESREADKALKISSRERKRQEARDEIINWLCNMKDSPYSRKEAEEIYENESKLHPNNVASLETFKNTYGRRTYLI